MPTIIKIILSGLLLGCLLSMPYGYFQFIRIAGCAAFAYLAYTELQRKSYILGIVCVGCAILLNPVFKIYLGRVLWNKVDLVLAIFLIIWTIFDFIGKKRSV